MLGLPDGVRALLFDLDGVLTKTAVVHTAAWKAMFDAFLSARGVPAFSDEDYLRHVDGRPRLDGIRGFLASRGIALPEGGPNDPPEADTVHGLGARKNALVLELIRRDGVEAYPDAVAYLDAAGAVGAPVAVVSSSANCRLVLEVTGLAPRFPVVVDGVAREALGLAGKPAPDTFLEAARELGASPAEAAVFEDAIAGVQAGAAGGFGAVVGIGREGPEAAAALRDAGATTVVTTLTDLLEAAA
jgi:beta-phosphoglucomutase family hydrolase